MTDGFDVKANVSSSLSLYSHRRCTSEDVSLESHRKKPLRFVRYNASLYVPFFWVDDYYITGAVASAAFVRHAQLRSLYSIPDTAERERFMSWEIVLLDYVRPFRT